MSESESDSAFWSLAMGFARALRGMGGGGIKLEEEEDDAMVVVLTNT